MDIKPGTIVSVTVTKAPTNAAAEKTLTRLFRKDPAVARHHRLQQRKRPSFEEWRRGNATWHHQMKTKPAAKVAPGASYKLRATLDVIRDLASVSRFVDVKPAK